MLYYEDNEITKPIKNYFNRKPGDILTANKTNEVYKVKLSKYVSSDIVSWVGYCGVHYYPTINIHYLSIGLINEPNITSGGWLGGLDFDGDMQIKPTRVITEEDMKIDPERWVKEDIGGFTNAFLSEDEAQKAIDDFKEKRLQGWKDYDKI